MVKPGITGWAQINYPYGASVEDARDKLEYDLYYAKNYTPFLDLLILLQTLRVVLWPEGARDEPRSSIALAPMSVGLPRWSRRAGGCAGCAAGTAIAAQPARCSRPSRRCRVLGVLPAPGRPAARSWRSSRETARNLAWLACPLPPVRQRRPMTGGMTRCRACSRAVAAVIGAADRARRRDAPSSLDRRSRCEALAIDQPDASACCSRVGALVLVHNLYAGASPAARAALRWPPRRSRRCGPIDLNLYTVAYSRRGPASRAASRLRGAGAAGPARAAVRARRAPRRRPADPALALVALPVVLAAGDRRLSGGDGARRAGARLARRRFGAAGAGRLRRSRIDRGRAAVAAFGAAARLAAGDAGQAPVPASLRLPRRMAALHRDDRARRRRRTPRRCDERVVQAVADITDSPAALLLLAGDDGGLALARAGSGRRDVPPRR